MIDNLFLFIIIKICWSILKSIDINNKIVKKMQNIFPDLIKNFALV